MLKVKSLKSYFNHCFCRFTNFYNGGRNAPVPLSLFADLERILRRLYVFTEEPCKSTTTTSEPCSPVFKEVQPRPSEHSNLEYHINNLNLYLYVFGLFIIFVIKAIQPDCDKIKGISVLLLETPLTRSKYFSPYTHAQHRMRTSRTVHTFVYKLPLQIIKSQQFKEYTRYSLQSCFAKALELEGEFMVGEVVTPRYCQASILGV